MGHDRDVVDIALDRNHLERELTGHAIAVAVEGNGLILVNRNGRLDHARVEPMLGQWRCRSKVFGEVILDREGPEERLHHALAFRLAASAKEHVQLIEIGDARHRRREPLLHCLDGPFGVGLLVAPRRHTEPRLKDVMTRSAAYRG